MKAQSTEHIKYLDESDNLYQLRKYELNEENKAFFYVRFDKVAMPIMEAYGFRIIEAWEAYEKGKYYFVYILFWENEKELLYAWQQFMDDTVWKAAKENSLSKYGEMVLSIEDIQMKKIKWKKE